MTGDHWRQVEGLYARVRDLAGEERQRALDDARPASPDVVAEVESLLSHEPPSETYLSTPWITRPPGSAPDLSGRRIGAFRLTERIGSGGMGVVYRAERDTESFSQQVAVKIVTASPGHAASLRQFNTERQLLAGLRHPHIVSLFDGGVTDDGLAYLVMEYVEGLPLTRYCRDRRLGLDQRLRLFQQVCGAIQYAHRHAVVHRDLKPGNVLVTSDGLPKILDFGIARLLTEPSGGHTTAGPWKALTPNYASPDHIRGLPPTTADDVYGLGVMLFELIAGRPPYDTAGLTLDAMLHLVAERPAPRPSSVATPDESGISPRELEGNLDAIVSKGLAKDTARRYGSAQELADDIGRHLDRQAVVAREPSLAYVMATVARRHRAMVAATVVSVVAVVATLGVSLVQTRRAMAARDRADQRFADVRRLTNALIFDIHDAVRPLAGSTPARERIVTEALRYLEILSRDSDDDALRVELSQAYRRLAAVQGSPSERNRGDRAGALASYEKALALLSPAAGRSMEAAMALVETQLAMAPLLNALGRGDAATAAVTAAAETAERIASRAPPDDRVRALIGLAYFHRASFPRQGTDTSDAIAWWRKAGEVYDALLAAKPDDGSRQRNVALVAKYLGEQYRLAGDLEQARLHHLRAQQLDAARLERSSNDGQAKIDLAIDWASLGGLYRQMGRLPDAVESLEASLVLRQELAAADPSDDYVTGRLVHLHGLLGRTYDDMSQANKALHHLREAVRLGTARPEADTQAAHEWMRNLVLLAQLERKAGLPVDTCSHVLRGARLARTDASSLSAPNGEWRATLDALETEAERCRAASSTGR